MYWIDPLYFYISRYSRNRWEQKDKIVINKVSSVDRFDIVVLYAPNANEYYVKRVIGITGDSIQIKDDVFYINGIAYKETYVNKNINSKSYNKVTGDFKLQDYTSKKTIPKGHYFILGDNRWESNDSRDFGFISAKSIIGEVKYRFYPLQDIGIPRMKAFLMC